MPELDKERLRAAWREEVFALYLAEGKIDAGLVENMRSWPHSGFGADQSVLLAAGDRAGIERVVQYMTRCPFSLSRLVKVSADRAGDLQGGEGRLPGLSRPARTRPGQRARSGISSCSRRWIFWPSSRNTFRRTGAH